MTFEYTGSNFYYDMDALARCPEIGRNLVSKRRKDVPPSQRNSTNWWVPLKILGKNPIKDPMPTEESELSLDEQYRSIINGDMMDYQAESDIAFDEDDWSESVHI